MAGRLNALKKGVAGAVMLVLACGGASVLAQQLPDPTRPAGGALSADPTTAAAPVAVVGVQAVFLRPGQKSAALINGRYVVQGAMLGDKRVLKIGENEVVLRDVAGQKEILKVVTGAEKTPIVKKIPATGKKRRDGTQDVAK
ncbi:MAG: hypothetical protein Q8O25_00795 [Sulfurisoma sp.]|nr:hypothetical protein [Sulfurisoma sp.]